MTEDRARIQVTLIPGDGIGPECIDATRRIVEAAGAPIDWELADAGADVFKKGIASGVPQETMDSIGRTKVASVLAQNRSVLRSQIIRRPAEPLPSERRSDAPSDGATPPPRSKHATGPRSRRTRPRTRTAAGHR